MRAVEDRDVSLLRRAQVDAPEKVVRQLRRGGRLEAPDVDAQRVERAEHLANGRVLAAGVHRLQHDQQRVLSVGEELLLQRVELLGQLVQPIFELILGQPAVLVGGEALEIDLGAGFDAVSLGVQR